MLAYAADRRPAGRAVSPRTLLLVVTGHAALLVLVMTARGDLPLPRQFDHIQVIFVDPVKPPPPPPPQPQPPHQPTRSVTDHPLVQVPLPLPNPLPLDTNPLPTVTPTPDVGTGTIVTPPRPLPPLPAVVRKAPRFASPPDSVRPPYPDIKRRLEEEADLRLTLQVDPRGRVVAVDPVGAADPVFLDAARRHILKAWRYQPASEDGQAVASRVTVTLHFRLDE